MARFEWGPDIGSVDLATPAAPAGGVKDDVEVSFAGYTPEGLFHFEVPQYNTVAFNRLNAMHVVIIADGTPVPTDPAAAVADDSTLPHFRTDCSQLLNGGSVSVDATSVPGGKYTAMAVREFDQ